MELPQVRPGKVTTPDPTLRVVAYFPNASMGNSAIQWLTGLGIPNDRLGITPPERLDNGQGMVLAIPCLDPPQVSRVVEVCKTLGASVHRTRR